MCLNDLVELKLLRKTSVKAIHAADEMVGVLKQLSTSLEVSINSEVINHTLKIQQLEQAEDKGGDFGRAASSNVPFTFEGAKT